MSQIGSEIIRNGLILETRGLAKGSHPELQVSIKNPTLTEEGEVFLSFVIGYLAQNKTGIKPGETLAYGY